MGAQRWIDLHWAASPFQGLPNDFPVDDVRHRGPFQLVPLALVLHSDLAKEVLARLLSQDQQGSTPLLEHVDHQERLQDEDLPTG